MASLAYQLRFDQINMLLKKASMVALYAWGSGFVAWVSDDLQNLLIKLLDRTFAGQTSWPEWTASTAVSRGDSIQNGDYRYLATAGGTTGGTAPTFPATIAATITDGGVTWECIERLPIVQFDDALTSAKRAIGQIGKTREDASLHIHWPDAVGCAVDTTDIVSTFEWVVSGRTIQVVMRVTGAGTLGDAPSYEMVSAITKGEAVTNSGTAALIVDEVYCSGTCPTLTGFRDCQYRLYDTVTITNHINKLLAAVK